MPIRHRWPNDHLGHKKHDNSDPTRMATAAITMMMGDMIIMMIIGAKRVMTTAVVMRAIIITVAILTVVNESMPREIVDNREISLRYRRNCDDDIVDDDDELGASDQFVAMNMCVTPRVSHNDTSAAGRYKNGNGVSSRVTTTVISGSK